MNGASLPPARRRSVGTATPTAAPTCRERLLSPNGLPLKLVANRPAVFALYALPHPSMSRRRKHQARASLTRNVRRLRIERADDDTIVVGSRDVGAGTAKSP